MTLVEAVELAQVRPLSRLEQQGLIQVFEFTHELAWNVLKDYLEDKGITGLIGSKDATRSAFKNGLISHAELKEHIERVGVLFYERKALG